MMNPYIIGFIMIIIGILIIFLGVIITFIKAKPRGGIEGGGLILIGPFPIIFGTNSKILKLLIALMITMMLILILFSIIPLWRFKIT